MKLLLVSSINLSSNPRIFKELQLAYSLHYDVTFLGFKHGNWSDKGDAEIQKQYPLVNFNYLDATRDNYFNWLYCSLLHVFCKWIWPLNQSSLKLTAAASSKRTLPILNLLVQLAAKNKYDLIIGHTLPALYPCLKFKQLTNCNFAFDVEDYHPGELIASDAINEKKRTEKLLLNILPLTSYITAASPLIAKNTELLVPGIEIKTVLNYFPKDEFVVPAIISSDKIKIVWFSQTITAGRGLEFVLSVWDNIKSFSELTLIGKIDPNFYELHLKKHDDITVMPPLLQQNLHKHLSFYDVGLALEIDNIDQNKGLALSNKILAYYQAGLYIAATDTIAQQNFINDHGSHGVIIPQNSLSMQNTFMGIHAEIKHLRDGRNERYAKAQSSSWESESAIVEKEWMRLNKKKILFVSSINLALNPRIYKEMKLAKDLNYEMEFIGFDIGHWKKELDNNIKKKFHGVPINYISARRRPFFAWLVATIVENSCRILYFIFKKNITINAYACTKRSFLLNRFLKNHFGHKRFDFIVAHTLSTLSAVQKHSARINCPFGFDVEDYHPGEKIFSDATNEKKRRELLIRRLLPSASYISAASPLISAAVKELANVKVTTVLNYFPTEEFAEPCPVNTEKIKLVWFSQNIDAGRGIELVISSWDKLKQNFELTLIGKVNNKFYEEWLSKYTDIIIINPLSQKALHKNLSHYDVGLAIDVDHDDHNRKLAITNKLLAYYQAGLYILATDTLAQSNFLEKNYLHGRLTKQDPSSTFDTLKEIFSEKEKIRSGKYDRFINASKSSWETESLIVKNEWEKINIKI